MLGNQSGWTVVGTILGEAECTLGRQGYLVGLSSPRGEVGVPVSKQGDPRLGSSPGPQKKISSDGSNPHGAE